jgi:hypothetical protein
LRLSLYLVLFLCILIVFSFFFLQNKEPIEDDSRFCNHCGGKQW